MISRTGILAALLGAASCAPPAVAQDKALGTFRDWSATRFGSGEEVACMAFSQPTKSEGKYDRRGDAFVFVTHRPGAGDTRISVETGYTYKAGGEVQVTVDDLSLALETEGSTAWLAGAGDTGRLIAAMRAGRKMSISGTSSRGTRTVDHYSLYGFSAAHAAVKKACRKP